MYDCVCTFSIQSPQVRISSIVKSRMNPFLELASTKKWELSFLLKETTGPLTEARFPIMSKTLFPLRHVIHQNKSDIFKKSCFVWQIKHSNDTVHYYKQVTYISYFANNVFTFEMTLLTDDTKRVQSPRYILCLFV